MSILFSHLCLFSISFLGKTLDVFRLCHLHAVHPTHLIFLWRCGPNSGQGLLIFEVSRSHKTTHHSRWDSSGRVGSLSQRPLPNNTQHSQETNIHASHGIRTHNLSRRAAVDLRLRPPGHWDRPTHIIHLAFCTLLTQYCAGDKV